LIGAEYDKDGIVGVIASPMMWAVSVTVIGTYVTQMKCTVDGLEQCSAMIVVSAQSVTEEVWATLGGICYFQDYKQFELWSALVFVGGNSLAVAGVLFLAYYRLAEEREDMDDIAAASSIELSLSDLAFEEPVQNSAVGSAVTSTSNPAAQNGEHPEAVSAVATDQQDIMDDHNALFELPPDTPDAIDAAAYQDKEGDDSDQEGAI